VTEFLAIVDEYVSSRFGRSAPVEPSGSVGTLS
jgi:hypothetical protein